MTEQGYRAPEAKRIAGISYRQLDYWTRTGLVTPSVKDAHGSGSQRLYSFQDLATLRVIKKLLDTGVSLQRVRKAVEHLQGMNRRPHGVTLMSDGTGVYEAHSPDAVVDLLKGGQGVFAISLDAVYQDLEDSVGGAPATTRAPARAKARTAKARRAAGGT